MLGRAVCRPVGKSRYVGLYMSLVKLCTNHSLPEKEFVYQAVQTKYLYNICFFLILKFKYTPKQVLS
jgi:hypothetical protein